MVKWDVECWLWIAKEKMLQSYEDWHSSETHHFRHWQVTRPLKFKFASRIFLKHKGKAIEKQQALECFRRIDSLVIFWRPYRLKKKKKDTCRQYQTRFLPTYFKYAAKLQILLIQDSIIGKEILIILFWEYHSKDYQEWQHLLLFVGKIGRLLKKVF